MCRLAARQAMVAESAQIALPEAVHDVLGLSQGRTPRVALDG
jgi:hypothetical protein